MMYLNWPSACETGCHFVASFLYEDPGIALRHHGLSSPA
jgi:hypothetical protein